MGSHLALQPIARVCMDLGVHPFAKQHTGDAADVVPLELAWLGLGLGLGPGLGLGLGLGLETLQLAAVLAVLVAVKARELVKVKGV